MPPPIAWRVERFATDGRRLDSADLLAIDVVLDPLGRGFAFRSGPRSEGFVQRWGGPPRAVLESADDLAFLADGTLVSVSDRGLVTIAETTGALG